MAAPALVPRRATGGIVAVWVVAALIGLAIGLFVPAEWRAAWLVVGLGGSLALSFTVQLVYGRSQGYIERVAISILGALLVMGVISLGFGLASLVPG
jgi:hypothetical protein